MNLLQSQQEKARKEWSAIVDFCEKRKDGPSAFMHDNFLDSLISSTVTAVLDGVREVMPGKNNDHLTPQASGGWNAYRTALLKSLEEMEGKGV